MKCTKREQAIDRYGPIDLTTGFWPNQNKWLKMFDVPVGYFPGWLVLDSHVPVTHILCNVDMHWPLMTALERIHSEGLGYLLKTYDGCFEIRTVRENNSLISVHSYGLGIDINSSTNQLGQTSGGFYDFPNFVKCFTDQKMDWGGAFIGRKDPQHFSYAWE